MALFRRFFYRKPPDGLLEISERVFVFDCCFTTDVMDDDEYKVYVGGIVAQLREYFTDASFMVFNFREGEKQSQIAKILSEYDMTVMDYPRQYENCPLLTMEMIHHFLRSSESWLSLGQRNVLLMHCEHGGWPVLAFMLAALLIYRKQYTGEQKTLDMIYKQAPRELLQLMSPLNPLPSQLRYLQYVSRRNVGSVWPPLDRSLTLDCIILRFIPNMDGEGGCRPIFRIYGQDPFMAADRTPKVLFLTPKRSKFVREFKQADCLLFKIDINCHIQGDVVLKCISLDNDLEREQMMFQVMFNTAFIRSNILILNRDDVDVLWNGKDQFPKDFRAEVLFSEMDSTSPLTTLDVPGIEEKGGLPIEAFAKVQEIFSYVDWLDPKRDVALNMLQKITSTNILQETLETGSLQNVKREKLKSILLKGATDENLESFSPQIAGNDSFLHERSHEKDTDGPKPVVFEDNITSSPSLSLGEQSVPSLKPSTELNLMSKNIESQELQAAFQQPAQPKILTQRIRHTSLSNAALYCNSQQALPVSISRYHSAPSVLGITALLHDHAEPNAKEASHPMTMSPACSVSAPELAHIGKLVQPSTVSNLQPPPLFPLEATTVTRTAVTRPRPPPLPPHHLSASESSLSLLNHSCGTLLQGTGLSSSVPPLPSLPESSPSVSKWNSVPAPAPSPRASSSGVDSFLALPISSLPLHLESTTGMKSSASPPLPSHIHSNIEPLHSLVIHDPGTSLQGRGQLSSVPPTPPPPPSFSGKFSSFSFRNSYSSTTLAPAPSSGEASSATPTNSMPPPPPLPASSRVVSSPTMKNSSPTPPPPPPPPSIGSSDTSLLPIKHSVTAIGPPPPPPPPLRTEPAGNITTATPPPPPPPSLASNSPVAKSSLHAPPVQPPPAPFANGLPKSGGIFSHSQSAASTGNIQPIPGPPFSAKGRLNSRTSTRNQGQSSKKTSLKPYHWLKLTRAMQGSLWAEAQKSDEASKAPEFDMSELESLFSANVPNSDPGSRGGKSNRHASILKSEKVNLIDLRRAYNCEIMLTKVKIPLPDLMYFGVKKMVTKDGYKMMWLVVVGCYHYGGSSTDYILPHHFSSVLALDDSALDVDQVDNLIKFCPTKEEMELLKNYKGDKENLGKCEQFFLELMKVPRVEAKLRVFSFKIQFYSQVSDLRKSLNIVNSTSEEVRNSVKLMRIMQTILSLGNALNRGTARGSAVGFRLDSLLKLSDTRARNNKLTLMHYLCKVLAEKLAELLDFPKDLVSLEASTKIQLKYLAEEMQAISKGLEKIVQELAASENDGPVSENFCKILKEFLGFAESEVRSLASLYSVVGRNADALALYFGEDPARCPFEQVVSTLLNFVRMFERALEENRKQQEFEKKKAQKEAENEKEKLNASRRKSEMENMKASDPESKHFNRNSVGTSSAN